MIMIMQMYVDFIWYIGHLITLYQIRQILPCCVSSGEGIHNNRALGDKFLKFCMVLGMGSVFSKSIANKMGVTSGAL